MPKREFQPGKFVNYTLKPADTKRLKLWAEEHFSDEDRLTQLTRQGYKLTFMHDDSRHCFACWAVPTNATSENTGLILSGRGGTPTNAFVEVCWKHLILFQGHWPSPTDDGSWTWDDPDSE